MLERLVERIFPTRASTQTWMILTLLLVVGIAVAAVGLYITFVLRSEVQIAYQQTMLQQMSRVTSILESDQEATRRYDQVRTMTRFGDLRITIVQDSVVLDMDRGSVRSDQDLMQQPGMIIPKGSDFHFSQ